MIDETRVLTCSHVTASVGTTDHLWITFPKADPPTRERRRVVKQVPAQPLRVIDVTVLHLDGPVPMGVRRPRLCCPKPDALREERWWAFGFASSDPVGHSADGVVGES